MITVDVANQSQHPVDAETFQRSVELVLLGEDIQAANISVAVVADEEMQALNRRYLAHDYPTDVLSFPLSPSQETLEGEVIVSADTAARLAGRYGWSMREELLLYLIHGTLHLVGYDDATSAGRERMRERERHYLKLLGHEPAYDAD